MAEVRLRFGKGAYKLSKPQNRPLLDKNGKPALKAVYVASLINSPKLWEIGNDRVGSDNKTLHGTKPANASKETLLDFNISKLTGPKSKGLQIHVFSRKSLCLGKHGKLLSTHTSPTRRSPYGLANDYLWISMSSIRAYSGTQNNSGPEEPLSKSKSSYYDILEVSSSATRAQIKTAYYKQSFIYHPDKNAGSEDATFRFSQISEAYSVLGNKELRRKYDRGILSPADLRGSSRATGRESPASGQQTRARHSPSVGAAQQKIFDFDTFIKSHYGEQLQRERQRRQRTQEMLEKDTKRYEESKKDNMAEAIVLVIMSIGAVFMVCSRK